MTSPPSYVVEEEKRSAASSKANANEGTTRPPLADWVLWADDIRPYKSLRHPP